MEEVSRSRGEIQKIREGLFITSFFAATKIEKLREKKIDCILVCGSFLNEKFPNEFVYKTIEIGDNTNSPLLDHLGEAIRFIEEHRGNGKNVLLHCASGISRSGSFLIGYLMYKEKKDYDEVLKDVVEKREVIAPNPGFEEIFQRTI